MKLISLNTWGGRAGLDGLLDFFRRHADTDVFCLQEVWNGGEHMLDKTAGGMKLDGAEPRLLEHIERMLPEHHTYFRPHFFDFYGLAMLIKKDLHVREEGESFVYKERGFVAHDENGDHARNIQYASMETPQGLRTVINFHGLWRLGSNKVDNEDRLLQSDNIARFVRTLEHSFVLCGDFNLLPDTESMKRLETEGLRNLIKEYGITSTRTHFYTKGLPFADYALVSGGIEVKDFKVLSDVVSDHSPLYLDFV